MTSIIQDVLTPGWNYSMPKLNKSWIIWLHSRATVAIFLLMFVVVTFEWYSDSPMTCVNLSDRSAVWDYFQRLCFSYSFTNSSRAAEGDSRVYAPHYRWIHPVALVLMFLYYSPQLVVSNFSAPIAERLLKDIISHKDKEYDNSKLLKNVYLFVEEMGWHSDLYTAHLQSHLFALFINLTGIAIIDTLFQNEFVTLVPLLFPFSRDSRHFRDPLSLLFPPFVTCEVGPEMMLLNYKSEILGCHLTLMELYEKIFIGMWFWQAMLFVTTVFQCILLIVTPLVPAMKKRLISVAVELHENDIDTVVSRYNTGDLMLLANLRNAVDGVTYRKALHYAAVVQWREDFSDEYPLEEEPIIALL